MKLKNIVKPEWFCEVESKFLCSVGDVIISGTEHNMKFKFSMLTYLTYINTILEYYHASVIIYL